MKQLIFEGEIDMALRLLEEKISSDLNRSRILVELVKELVNIGKDYIAKQIADKISIKYHYFEALEYIDSKRKRDIVIRLVDEGKFDKAKQLVEEISVQRYYLEALEYIKYKLKEKAIELIHEGKLDEAINMVVTIDVKDIRSDALEYIAKKLIDSKDFEKIRNLIKKLVEVGMIYTAEKIANMACISYCDNCQSPMELIAKSYDKKLSVYYCKSCDSAKGIDEELYQQNLPENSMLLYELIKRDYTAKLPNLKMKLENNNEKIIVYNYFYNLFYIGNYLPKIWYTQDDFSKDILRFKNGDTQAVKWFSIVTATFVLILIKSNKIPQPDVVIPIPSSSAGRVSFGHKYLCEHLSKRLNIENGTNYLRRIESLPPSHLLGTRPTVGDHYRTIHCLGNVNGKNVLLFDDVYTSGNTARACIKRLVENGAKHITLITLGRTVW